MFGLQISGLWIGILSVIFGIIILLIPRVLNYLIAIYLIIVGILAIIGAV